MAHERLSRVDDWELVHEDQDIRGWDAVDADGDPMGTVDDLIVDTDSEMVARIVLDDGAEYPVAEVEIGDEVVYLHGAVAGEGEEEPVVRVYDETTVRRRET